MNLKGSSKPNIEIKYYYLEKNNNKDKSIDYLIYRLSSKQITSSPNFINQGQIQRIYNYNSGCPLSLKCYNNNTRIETSYLSFYR